MPRKAKQKKFHSNADISESFWDEVHSRGFFVEHENGGKRFHDYDNYYVKRITPEVFKLVGLFHEENIAFISADLFMRTVKKIEGMLNYKLFM